MTEQITDEPRTGNAIDPALACLALVAGYYRIAADPVAMRRDLGLAMAPAGVDDMLRSALRIGNPPRRAAGRQL